MAFAQERRTARKYLTAEAARRLMGKLADCDEALALTAIEASIEAGWTGIFPKSTRKSPGTFAPDSRDAYEQQLLEEVNRGRS